MREHVEADEPFVREDVPVGDALERFVAEGQDYKVELIEDLVRNAGRRTPSRSTPTARSPTCAAARTRPARSGSRRSSCSRSRAPTGAATRASRCSRASTGRRSSRSKDLERVPRAARAGPRERPPQARPAARAVHVLRRRAGSGVLAAGRHRGVQRAGRAAAARWARERGYTEVKTPQLYDSSLWKTSGHWDKYREQHVRHRVRGPGDGAQADELPRPLPAVLAAAALLPRPAGPLLRAGAAAPQRAERHAARAAAGAALRAGRRAHLLHRGPDPGRGRGVPRVRVRDLRRCSGSTCGSSSRPGPSSGSAATSCGTTARRRSQHALETRASTYDLNEGDGAFYGPEDRHAHDRLARPLVAARHGAARLQLPRALRAHLHRRRQRRAPPGDDPPGADGLLRALHRDPARAPARASCRCGSRRCRRSCCRSPTATTSTRPASRSASRDAGLRAELDDRTESVARKIRDAELRKIPYMLVVGDREQESDEVAAARAPPGRRRLGAGGRRSSSGSNERSKSRSTA